MREPPYGGFEGFMTRDFSQPIRRHPAPDFTNVDKIIEEVKALALPSNSSERKGIPMVTGVLDYFPDALAAVALVSKAGNDKHNPGEPLHHTRFRSMDHADSLLRHLVDRGKIDPDTDQRHSAEVAWRALALLQEEIERDEGAELPRGAVAAPVDGRSYEEREAARKAEALAWQDNGQDGH